MTDFRVIEFDVRYGLCEYLGFNRDVLRKSLPDKFAANGGISPISMNLLIIAATPISIIAFFVKSAKVGRCHFKIDSSGIRRTTKSGTAHLKWSDVTETYRNAKGIIIGKASGGYVVPYRAMSDQQQNELDNLLLANSIIPK